MDDAAVATWARGGGSTRKRAAAAPADRSLATGGTAPLAADLTGEIGALRVAMARLLAEETDPVRLAGGVARLADATGRALKAQRALGGDAEDEVTRTFRRVLAEMDAETTAGVSDEDEEDAWGSDWEDAADPWSAAEKDAARPGPEPASGAPARPLAPPR